MLFSPVWFLRIQQEFLPQRQSHRKKVFLDHLECFHLYSKKMINYHLASREKRLKKKKFYLRAGGGREPQKRSGSKDLQQV